MEEFCTRLLADEASKPASDLMKPAVAWHSAQYSFMMLCASEKEVFPSGLGVLVGVG